MNGGLLATILSSIVFLAVCVLIYAQFDGQVTVGPIGGNHNGQPITPQQKRNWRIVGVGMLALCLVATVAFFLFRHHKAGDDAKPSNASAKPSVSQAVTSAPPNTSPDPSDMGTPSSSSSPSFSTAPPESVSVLLSGSEVPDGMKVSTDGDGGGEVTDWSVDDVTIGNQTFDSAFVARCSLLCSGGEQSWYDVKLARKYKWFDGSFGIAADSPANDRTHTVKVEITDRGTGRKLEAFTLKYGAVIPVKQLDVSEVGILRIRFYGWLGDMHVAVGEPTVRQ
ncbi:hypothetical protein HUT11_15890 [Streptomyces seoulensis]|nr:hypothetical protein HUT11_15890 [Streptomyces seoulensis]